MAHLLLGLLLGLVASYLLGRRRELAAALKERRDARTELGFLTRDELYKRAQAEDLPGRSTMSKDELQDALGATARQHGHEVHRHVGGT
jgi:hypothetical protein